MLITSITRGTYSIHVLLPVLMNTLMRALFHLTVTITCHKCTDPNTRQHIPHRFAYLSRSKAV